MYYKKLNQESFLKPKNFDTNEAIRVDLVDLPQLTQKQKEDMDLTKKVNPNLTAKTKSQKKVKKVILPSKKSNRLSSLRDRLRSEQIRKQAIEKLGGAEDERAPIRGNKLSKGHSASGDVGQAGDLYKVRLKDHVRRYWNVPQWMRSKDLKATVLVKLTPDGRVLSTQFVRRSGSAQFDKEIVTTIERSEPVPPPPKELRRYFIEEGIEWDFQGNE